MNKLFRLLVISLLSFNVLGYLNAGCGCDVIIEEKPEVKCESVETHKKHHKKHRRHHCKKHKHCKHKHIHHKSCC